jgi:hypothetical protein
MSNEEKFNKIPFTGFLCDEDVISAVNKIVEKIEAACIAETPNDVVVALAKYIAKAVNENYIHDDVDKCIKTLIYAIEQLHVHYERLNR